MVRGANEGTGRVAAGTGKARKEGDRAVREPPLHGRGGLARIRRGCGTGSVVDAMGVMRRVLAGCVDHRDARMRDVVVRVDSACTTVPGGNDAWRD